MRLFTIVYTGVLVLLLTKGLAQPVNDSIAHRIPLFYQGDSVVSSTEGATVEWPCVDELLTGQCVEYHNDQWFSYTPTEAGPVYLNLYGQQCRDVRGVQVVIFLGEPCQPESYTPIVCYSTGTQDDVYLRLDSLQVGEEYLINIDGYLNDQCAFVLEVSDVPKGVPAQATPQGELLPVDEGDSSVLLQWQLPMPYGAELAYFEVHRHLLGSPRSTVRGRVSLAANSLGEVRRTYHFLDSLEQGGSYQYHIWAVAAGQEAILMGKRNHRWRPNTMYWRAILYYPRHTQLLMVLRDGLTGQELGSDTVTLNNGYFVFEEEWARHLRAGRRVLCLQVYDGQQLMDEFVRQYTP